MFVDPLNPLTQRPLGLNVTMSAPIAAVIGRQMNPLSGVRFFKRIGKLKFQNIIDCLPQVDPHFMFSYYQNMYKQKYWKTYVQEAKYMANKTFFFFFFFFSFYKKKIETLFC